ncbi:MAG: hypothetical protein PVSMB11_08530 [Desulfuromonadaceae bacterium]
MQTLLLNGCNLNDEYAQRLLPLVTAVLGESGNPPQVINLEGLRIADCTGCFGCWTRTPGECVIHDDAPAVTARMAHAERIVFFCPVVFGGFAPELKRVIERSISLFLPFMRVYRGESHHPVRYGRQYELCGVGILNRPDPEAAASFRERLRRLSLNYNGTRFSSGTLIRDGALDAARIRAIIDVREEI